MTETFEELCCNKYLLNQRVDYFSRATSPETQTE